MAERIKSTEAARTDNSPMRHQYRVLTDAEKAEVEAVKSAGEALLKLLMGRNSSRELSIAITKTEEAVMWAVKDITK